MKTTHRICVLVLTFCLTPGIMATSQAPDVISIGYQDYALFSNPLEPYFGENHPRPKFLTMTSTACYRGYVAHWVIRGDMLLLEKMERRGRTSFPFWMFWKENHSVTETIPLELIFNRKGPILASWFSGELRIPIGRELRYVHMGYGSVYEFEMIARIEKGAVKGIEMKDMRQSKQLRDPNRGQQALEEMFKSNDLGQKSLLDGIQMDRD